MWTEFEDRHWPSSSRRHPSVPIERSIYIEADSEEEAIEIFILLTHVDPRTSHCSCCQQDYDIRSAATEDELGVSNQCPLYWSKDFLARNFKRVLGLPED